MSLITGHFGSMSSSRISELTIAHYDRLAEAYWEGTRDHDVNWKSPFATDKHTLRAREG